MTCDLGFTGARVQWSSPMDRLASQSSSHKASQGAHDLTGASLRVDWAVSGPFLVIVDFPAISYFATSSKKVATTPKKGPKLNMQNVIFFIHRIE